MTVQSRLKNFNSIFILNILLILLIGGIVVFTSTYFPEKKISPLFVNQIIFYLVGLFLFFILSILDISILLNLRFIVFLFVLTVFLLILVQLIGVSAGIAQRWISLGKTFTLQPSELAKITVILILAFSLSGQVVKTKMLGIKSFIKSAQFSGIMAVLFIIALIFIQNSLGNTILISLTCITIVLASHRIGLKKLLAASIFFTGLITILFALNPVIPIFSIIFTFLILKIPLKTLGISLLFGLGTGIFLQFGFENIVTDYQRDRIVSFINPQDNSLSINWNRNQAITAIGSGELFGEGLLQGEIVKNNLLPYAYTDFAFAAFAEQLGFTGVCVLIFIYLCLLGFLFYFKSKTTNKSEQIILIGIAGIIFFNMFQHIAMNLGITPITGVPLPLVSYGGSSVITYFIALGFAHSIYINSCFKERVFEKILF